MATTQASIVLRHIRGLAATASAARLPDQELLGRFAVHREEAAFEALVQRHGPLVLGVCRRVLGNWHDAEDAFQTAFLALARHAGSISKQASVGGWLHQVALNSALKAKARAASRHWCESQAGSRPASDLLSEVTGRELLAVLDEELLLLPEKYRTPLVLCYLEGRTRDEAAQLLGWSLGTLKRRLEQARESLRGRLKRRGLAFPVALLAAGLAQSATAAVPAALAAATVKAALPEVGVASVLAVGRLKVVAAVLLAVGLIGTGVGALAHRALAEKPAESALPGLPLPNANARPASPAAPIAPAEQAKPEAEEQVIVAGRVLDAQGKPVAGAEVAVLAQTCRPHRDKALYFTMISIPGDADQLAGRAKSDDEGRYRLTFPRSVLQRSYKPSEITVVSFAPGHAVGWRGVEIKEKQADVVLQLAAEEPVRGRLFDLQGVPAAGVQVHVVRAAEADSPFTGVQFLERVKDAPFWPPPVTTDEQGRFVLRGVNRKTSLTVRLHDDRFALHDLFFAPGEKEEKTLALAPPHVIEGQVIKADTREPAPGIVVNLSGTPNGPCHNATLIIRTDKEGRFRVNHYAVDRYAVQTRDWEGEPYFAINHLDFEWPRGAKVKHAVEIALPRGVLQKGKVVDAEGKPVAGASLLYLPKLYGNPFIKEDPIDLWQRQIGRAKTREDGTFSIVALPGPGHLAVYAPPGSGQKYLRRHVDRAVIFGGQDFGGHWVAGDFIKLDVKPDAPPADVTGKLQPSVPLKLRLVDAEGQPLDGVRMTYRTFKLSLYAELVGPSGDVKEGRFEIAAVAAEDVYRLYYLDAKNGRAAIGMVDGKHDESKPLTVRWQECGSATARLVHGQGKPAAKSRALIWIKEDRVPGQLEGGTMYVPAPFRLDALTDAKGVVTLPELIPGVRYVLRWPNGGRELKEFTIKPGQKVDLGDIVVDPTE